MPPAWTAEPGDVAALPGAPLRLECAARGHPAPAVAWYRRAGESRGGRRGLARLRADRTVPPPAGEPPGDAEADERWERVDGGPWAATGGALEATAAPGLRGRYRCRADNGVGAPLLKDVEVAVHGGWAGRAGAGDGRAGPP